MGTRGGDRRFMARYVNYVRQQIEAEYRAADQVLSSSIDAVDTTVDNILSGSSESLDAFVEVVHAFREADAENSGSITALAISARDDRTLIRAELLASSSLLQNNIAHLSGTTAIERAQILSTLSVATASLETSISNESATRASSIATLSGSTATERAQILSTLTTATASLEASISDETSARTSSIAALSSSTTTAISDLSTSTTADRELIRQELSASATQINNNISLLSSSVSDTITNLSSSIDATIRAATFATASQGLSNVAGTTLILAGGDGYKYNFTIDDSGTPCITRIEQVSDLVSPDCVILQGDDGNKYKIHVDSQGTLSVPQIVSASAYDPNDPCNVSENNIC